MSKNRPLERDKVKIIDMEAYRKGIPTRMEFPVVEMDSVVLLGRSDECQLQLNDSKVSRFHCEFLVQDGEVLLRDLDSSNGTFLNGDRLPSDDWATLMSGDLIQVGPYSFYFYDYGWESQPSTAFLQLDTEQKARKTG